VYWGAVLRRRMWFSRITAGIGADVLEAACMWLLLLASFFDFIRPEVDLSVRSQTTIRYDRPYCAF
jgi:hypothetical protein